MNIPWVIPRPPPNCFWREEDFTRALPTGGRRAGLKLWSFTAVDRRGGLPDGDPWVLLDGEGHKLKQWEWKDGPSLTDLMEAVAEALHGGA